MPSDDLLRRDFLRVTGAAAASLALPSAFSQAPKTVSLAVGFPPGGTADSIGRVVAQLMGSAESSVIVENKPGASGQLAADGVRRAAADGSKLLLTPSSILSLVPHLYKKPMYDSRNDFAPLACVCDHSFALAVTGNSPIQSVAELIETIKKSPQEASYATAGAGTAMHFLGTIFSQEIGAEMAHVAYRGTAPGLQDLMAGQVLASFNPLPTMLELHRAKRIRILAVTNPARVGALPDIPTFSELGMPELELVEWYGTFASSKTPAPLLEALERQISAALLKPEMAESAKQYEVALRVVSSSELRTMLETDYLRWGQVVQRTGISLDN